MTRPTRWLFGWLAVAVLGCVAVAGRSEAASKKSAAQVKVTAKAGKPSDGAQTLIVSLVVAKGWHIYANPVGLKDLTDAQTVVRVSGKTKLEDVKIEYPPGTLIKDKIIGDYKVYEDKVEIKAVVKRAKDDTGPLEVTVKFQACNDKMCLPPATVKVPVE